MRYFFQSLDPTDDEWVTVETGVLEDFHPMVWFEQADGWMQASPHRRRILIQPPHTVDLKAISPSDDDER